MTQERIILQPEPEEKPKDDTADLFEVDSEELVDTDDLVEVDIDKDILDADEDGSFDDLTTVSNEDIMGDDMYGQSPLDGPGTQEQKKKQVRIARQVYKPKPIIYPTMGGMR